MPFFLPQIVTQKNALQLEQKGLLNLAALKHVDCASLVEFDSTVLAVLLAWQKELNMDGQSIVIEHAPEKLKVLAGVYGVSELLGW